MKSRPRTWCVLAMFALVATVLAGCGSGAAGAARLRIVASTNVYGDIAAAIAGKRASVVSIIDSPDQDPHSFEASARNELELSQADLVIANGGGYDDFVASMLRASGHTPRTIDVVKLSGHRANASGELNEHVWYDFAAMITLATAIRSDLVALDPGGAATYERNATTFVDGVRSLQSSEAAIRRSHAGEGVAVTEPVPLYMTQACGLVDKTPAAFSKAIEDGDDVPVRVLQQTLNTFTTKAVKVLVYNEQTSGPQTEQVLAAARSNGIPAVGVTETLPAGKSYLSWMRSNLDDIAAALA